MKDALHSLPRALAEVYDEVWLTLSRQDDQNKQVAYQVIGHLLKSATPLSLSTVQAILVANGGDAEESGSDPSTIIETCAGFVTLDTVNHRLCLIHASVREYLINLPVWTLVSDSLEIDISQYPSNDKSTGVVESKFAKQTDSGRDARDLAHLLEDEDVNSEISYSDSVFSQISRQTSQSSVFSQLETVTDQFARLYSSNEAIQETIVAALSAIGAAGFETIFAAELKTFSNDLQSLAKAPSQKIAAIMAGQRTRLIAKGTLREFEILENGDSAFFKLSTDERGGKAYLLDQYLKHRDPKKNTRKDEGQIESNQGPFQSNPAEESLNAHLDTVYLNKMDDFLKPVTQEAQLVDEEEEEDFGESYANLELVKDFIISEQPFDDLLERLRSKIAPADIVVDLPTFQIQVEDEGLPIFKSLRDDIARQDSLTLKDVIAILFVYLYQRWTRIFLRLEKPLKVGLQRVRWKCVSLLATQYY
jgi:hypothetical protein